MSQTFQLTEEMQEDQTLVHTDHWKTLYSELTDLKDTLLSKLMQLATASVCLHDAQLDPLIIKGLCLALDCTYRSEDIPRIRDHCAVIDQALVAHNGTKPTVLTTPTVEDPEIIALRAELLSNLLPTAQKLYLAWLFGKTSYHVNFFLCQVLHSLAFNPSLAQLKSFVFQFKNINLICVNMLKK
jgi:hypothetical protein